MNYYTAPQTILGKFPEKYKDVVIEIVAKEYNLTVDAIKARTRAWESSIPRMVCMHLLDSIISIPRPSIPSLFGMNRTSFYHAELPRSKVPTGQSHSGGNYVIIR